MLVRSYPVFPVPPNVQTPPQQLNIAPGVNIQNVVVDNRESLVPVWIYQGPTPQGFPLVVPAGAFLSEPIYGTQFLYAAWQGVASQQGYTFISVSDTAQPAAFYAPPTPFPQGASPFSGWVRSRLTGTGVTTKVNISGMVGGVSSFNIGQTVWVSAFGLLGCERQAYPLQVIMYDQDGATEIGAISLGAGKDVQPFSSPIPTNLGTFAKSFSPTAGASFAIASTYGDTIIGDLNVDLFLAGYVQ